MDLIDRLISATAFVLLIAFLTYAVKVGALRDEPLALVLVVLALLSPSPATLLIKWREFVAKRQRNHNPQNQSNHADNSESDLPQNA